MKILIDSDNIQTRISEMAAEIDEYYKSKAWYQRSDEPVIIVGVLTGAIFFMADLARKLSIRTELDFIGVSTYPGKTTKAQDTKIISAPTRSLHDAHILLVDDILDGGNTLRAVTTHLSEPYPEDIKTAVLLRKPNNAPEDVAAKFVGFDIENKWVAGYGMDDNGRHREIPFIFEVNGCEQERINESRTSKSEIG